MCNQKRILQSPQQSKFQTFLVEEYILDIGIQIKQIWRTAFVNLQTASPSPFLQAEGIHAVVKHKGLSHKTLWVPSNSGVLGEVLICTGSFINAFEPSFQETAKVPVLSSLSVTVFGSYWLTLAVRNTLKCSLNESTG